LGRLKRQASAVPLLLLAACTASRGLFSFRAPTAPSPNTWNVPHWYFDPQSSVAQCSDSNSGTSPSSPLCHYYELVARWGTNANTIDVWVTLTWNSAQPDTTSDPIVWDPLVVGNGFAEITCALTQIASGTLFGVVAKNQGSGTIWQATLAAGLSAYTLVNDSTVPARFWTYTLSSGTTWNVSQPVTPISLPWANNLAPAEASIANGDGYTASVPVSINLIEFRPRFYDYNDAGPSQFQPGALQQVSIASNSAIGASQIFLGTAVVVSESVSARGFTFDSIVDSTRSLVSNSAVPQGIRGAGFFSSGLIVQSGIMGSSGQIFSSVLANAEIDRDVIVGGNTGVDHGLLGAIYLPSGVTMFLTPGLDGYVEVGHTGPFYGPGKVQIQGSTRTDYGTAAGGTGVAATTFEQSGGLSFAGDSTGCTQVGDGGAVTINCGIPLTTTNLDTCPASTTAFCGRAFQLTGGTIFNGGP
jgi:hypothetical protein